MVEPVGAGSVGAFGLILKGLKTIKDAAVSVEVKSQVTDLYDVILAGQQSALEEHLKQRALLEEVRELKEHIASLEAWDAEKQRYALAEPWTGAVVYALKKSAANGEPPHYLCTHCYTDGKKSILNRAPNPAANNFTMFVCRCKSQVQTPYRGPVGAKYLEEIKPE